MGDHNSKNSNFSMTSTYETVSNENLEEKVHEQIFLIVNTTKKQHILTFPGEKKGILL